MRQPICGFASLRCARRVPVVCLGNARKQENMNTNKKEKNETLVGKKKNNATCWHSKSPHKYGVVRGPLLPSN